MAKSAIRFTVTVTIRYLIPIVYINILTYLVKDYMRRHTKLFRYVRALLRLRSLASTHYTQHWRHIYDVFVQLSSNTL